MDSWRGGALVASHDTALLQDFEHFFVLSESGCRYFRGRLAQLEIDLEREESARQAAYLSGLQRMVEHEEHSQRVARRRARKERYGRVREMDRGSPRVILNLKRNQAQGTHGKQKAERQARLEAIRKLAKAGRRALKVELPLVLPTPARESGRSRRRVAVTGPNGSGKTTLLNSFLTRSDLGPLGAIAQGAAEWMLEESLLSAYSTPSRS